MFYLRVIIACLCLFPLPSQQCYAGPMRADLAAGAAVAPHGLRHEFHVIQTIYAKCFFLKIIEMLAY